MDLKEKLTAALASSKTTAVDWLALLEEAIDWVDDVKRDPELLSLVKNALQAAYNDANFTHCYLSVAEDLEFLLR